MITPSTSQTRGKGLSVPSPRGASGYHVWGSIGVFALLHLLAPPSECPPPCGRRRDRGGLRFPRLQLRAGAGSGAGTGVEHNAGATADSDQVREGEAMRAGGRRPAAPVA